MNVMIWKEFRENAKWGLLGAIFTYVMLNYTMLNQYFYFESAEMLYFVSATSGFLGLALGLVQSYWETAPDRWAFLMHRPLSIRKILLSKMIVGITLLICMWFIVLLLTMYQIVNLKRVPYPMYAYRLIPPLLVSLVSIPAYFSGLFIVLWKPRWLITKAAFLGGLLLICMTFPNYIIFMTWNYLGISLLTVLLIASLYAYSDFRLYEVTGEHHRLNFIPRAGSSISTFIGSFMLIMFLGITSSEIMNPQRNYTSIDYQVTKSGDVIRMEKSYDYFKQLYTVQNVKNISNPDDKELPELSEFPQNEELFNKQIPYADNFYLNGNFNWYLNRNQHGLFRYGRLLQFSMANIENLNGIYNVSHHEGLIFKYLTPRISNEFEITGIIAKNGFFSPGDSKAESFGDIVEIDQLVSMRDDLDRTSTTYKYHSSFVVVTAHELFLVNVSDQSVTSILKLDDKQPITGVAHCAKGDKPVYLLEFPDEYKIYDCTINLDSTPNSRQNTTNINKIYLPHQLIGHIPRNKIPAGFSIDSTSNVLLINLIQPEKILFRYFNNQHHFFQTYNFQGDLLNEVKIDDNDPLYGRNRNANSFTSYLSLLMFPPLLLVMGISVTLLADSNFEYFANTLIHTELITILLIYLALQVALLFFARWYVRKYNYTSLQSKYFIWMTLLFGSVGFLAVWFIEEYLSQDQCINCGKAMSVSDNICPHCQSQRSSPEPSPKDIINNNLLLQQSTRDIEDLIPQATN